MIMPDENTFPNRDVQDFPVKESILFIVVYTILIFQNEYTRFLNIHRLYQDIALSVLSNLACVDRFIAKENIRE